MLLKKTGLLVPWEGAGRGGAQGNPGSNPALRSTEPVWGIRTYGILLKVASPAFWSSWLAQFHQARSIEHRKVLE